MPAAIRSIEVRLATYYAAHFAAVGAVVPYVALWFAHLGHSPGWTGAVVATPSLVMLLTTVALGRWADGLGDWRTAIVACNWIVLGVLSLWLVGTGEAAILLVWTLTGVLLLAKQPVVDAAALSLTARHDIAYGRVRAFGSIGFIVSLLIVGAVLDEGRTALFLPVILITAALRALAAHGLPRLRDARGTAIEAVAAPALLRHKGFLAVLAGAALINAAHAFYYTFGLLHWRELGIPTATGSALWAAAIAAEVLLMWRFASVAQRLSARHCLIAAGSLSALRWAFTAATPSVGLLALLQLLHAISFGLTFLASVSFIARRVDDRHAARAQAVLAVMSTGSMAVATVASGWLYERYAGAGYAAMSALALTGVVLVLCSYRSSLDDVAGAQPLR